MSFTHSLLVYLPLPVLIAAALWALWLCVPFDALSYGAWTGIILTLLALAALVKPTRWLWMPTRSLALLALSAGTVMVMITLTWPPTLHKNAGPHQRLDDFLPEYQAIEFHEARTNAPVSRVVEAIRQTSLEDMPAALVLMRIRALMGGLISLSIPANKSLLDMMLQPGSGFIVLDDSDIHDSVYGMVGTPWKSLPPPEVSSPAAFLAFHEPDAVRVAFNFKVIKEAGDEVRLSTETRILGTDQGARRAFARYWRLIYPGSAIIRRVWLDVIVRRAERGQP